jgi:hypothetical protein
MNVLKSNFWLLGIALMAAATMNFSSCKDDENGVDTPDNPTGRIDSLVSVYNDLEYFQSYFVATDSKGNLCYYRMGVPLYESDSTHLYIGVDNLDEAAQYFHYAIAPDIEQKVSVTNNYTYTLTDTLGNSQGSVSFVPGSGAMVAEITTDLPDLKYFNTVTFLQNSAWPHNSGEKVWNRGDIRTISIIGEVAKGFLNEDKVLNWVLMREPGNGVSALWCAITKNVYHYDSRDEDSFEYIEDSDYSMDNIYTEHLFDIIGACIFDKPENNFFVKKFKEAGCGELIVDRRIPESYYWNTTWRMSPDTRYKFIDGGVYPTIGGEFVKSSYANAWILKIDWNLDWLVKDPQGIYTITNAVSGESGESAANLFDNDPNTKWCSYKSNKIESEISGEDAWIVEFMTEKPINPTAYYMTTTNDHTQFPERAPRIWNLYAKESPNDVWVLIDKRDNTNSMVEQMTNANCWTGWWGVSAVNAMYQYFRLEMYEVQSGTCFQISELGFKYNETIDHGDELYYSLIDASDGEPQNLAGNLFDNNFDTKWCVDEDNKNSTPLADDKCWFVEFKASKPITPTGYHMVTANDHTMFPDRAPRKWSLFGLKDGWWVRLATVDNTNTDVLQMTNADKWTGNWSITEHKGEYQIFRLEMYENWGGDCFQISELGFNFQ